MADATPTSSARSSGSGQPSSRRSSSSGSLMPRAGRVKVLLLGGPGVGKTSLAWRLAGSQDLSSSLALRAPQPTSLGLAADKGSSDSTLTPRPADSKHRGPLPTIGVDFVTRVANVPDSQCSVRIHLWDTSGQERFRSLVDGYISELEDFDAAIVAYDVTDRSSFDELASFHASQVKKLAKGCPQLALVGLKADCCARGERRQRAVEFDEGQALAEELGIEVFVEACLPPTGQRESVTHSEGVCSGRHAVDEALLRPLLQRCVKAAAQSAPLPRVERPVVQAPHVGSPLGPTAPSCGSQALYPWRRCSQPLLKCFGLV